MCPLASCEAYQAAPCVALVTGSWQYTTHAEAVAQAFGTNARDALLFGSWQCITYADKCNIKRFALSGLVHVDSDASVQIVLPRSCIYESPGLL